MMTLEKEVPAQAPNPVPLLKRPQVLGLLAVALLAEIGYAVVNVSAMAPYLKEDRHIGASIFSVILSTYLLSEAISKSPMGHLADRYGRRWFMAFGPAMSIGTSVLTIAIPHHVPYEVIAFVLLRVIDGVGAGMLWPAAFATISDTVEPEQRQKAMSYLNTCYILGVALALPIGGFINDVTGQKSASFWLAAVLFTGVASAALFFVPKTQKTADSGELDPAHGGGEFSAKEFVDAAKEIPAYIVLAVLTFMGVGAPMPVIKNFPMEQFGMSETAIGAMVFPAAISMALLSVPMTKFGEKIGRMRSVHVGIGMCALGMACIASGMVLPFMRSPLVLALGAIPCGLGFLLAIPAWYATVSDISEKRRGIFIGTVMTAQGLGAILGALSGGFLEEALRPLGTRLGIGLELGRYMPFAASALYISLSFFISLKILGSKPAPKPGL